MDDAPAIDPHALRRLTASRPELAECPVAEFGFPGPQRDRLVERILAGRKTATTALLDDYRRGGEELPRVGQVSIVVDSRAWPVALIECTGVRVLPVGAVGADVAREEGEDFPDAAAWRAAHEGFWHGDAYRAHAGDPAFTVSDDTPAVVEWFAVTRRLGQL